jgi:hypothetical protein
MFQKYRVCGMLHSIQTLLLRPVILSGLLLLLLLVNRLWLGLPSFQILIVGLVFDVVHTWNSFIYKITQEEESRVRKLKIWYCWGPNSLLAGAAGGTFERRLATLGLFALRLGDSEGSAAKIFGCVQISFRFEAGGC